MKQSLLSEADASRELDLLNSSLEEPWQSDGTNLSKKFVFDNFVHAFGFMAQAAIEAEKLNHHPDWSNVYRTVQVNLTTHESGGLTELDFALATRMEKISQR